MKSKISRNVVRNGTTNLQADTSVDSTAETRTNGAWRQAES